MPLVGCAPRYIQPSYLTPGTAATVTQSKIHSSTATIPSIETNIVGVDNSRTGRFGAASILVAPGLHFITFCAFYLDGIGPFGDIGNVTLSANFQAGHTYMVRSTEPTLSWSNVVSADAWIVDESGEVVSAPGSLLLSGPAVIVP